MRSPRRILILALASSAAMLALATSAMADQTFHTLHAELSPVGGAPLQSGWVNDIHANGPIIGANEVYHVAGASPNTTYQVEILFYTGNTICSGSPPPFPTATLTTNNAGSANGTFTFPGGPPASEPNNSAIWELVGPGNVVDYTTDCEPVILD